jgi:hypothetical protein
MTGLTKSGHWVTEGFDPTHNGGLDAFVVKMSAGGGHVWSSFLGGTGDDRGYGITVDGLRNVFVTGDTTSSDWVSGSYDDTYGGGYDAFLVKIKDGPFPCGSLQVMIAPPECLPEGPRWKRSERDVWLVSGYTETAVPEGNHTVQFLDIPGWIKPADQTVHIAEDKLTLTTGTYRRGGSLCITILPQAVLSKGARWRRLGTTAWYESGKTESKVLEGDYTIEFTEVPDWITPGYLEERQDLTVTIHNDETTYGTGTYLRYGSLRVTVMPPEAMEAGGKWRISGTTEWHDSDYVETGLFPYFSYGTHAGMAYAVEFKDIPRWVTAKELSPIYITSGRVDHGEGWYYLVGTLQVNLHPPEAVAQGAQWNAGGPEWYGSGYQKVTSVGKRAIVFSHIPGWLEPDIQDTEVFEKELTVLDATYSLGGLLNVTILPPEAIAAGAMWRRVGTDEWLASNQTETGLRTGYYTIEFKDVPDEWIKPVNQTLHVIEGETTTATGIYTQNGSLCVTILPPEAAAAGAQWRRVGSTEWHDSGYTEERVRAGACTLEFKEIPGWAKPDNMDIIILGRKTCNVTATYRPFCALVWSGYMGGTSDDHALAVAADPAGSIFVTGWTTSSGWVANAEDTTFDGDVDAFLIKISASGKHLWSRYLGGKEADEGYAVAVDAAGSVFVAGRTRSSGWLAGGYDTTFGGDADAFLAKLSYRGVHLWSTYLGGKGYDFIWAAAVSSAGNVFVTGETKSSGWLSGGYNKSYAGKKDAFVAKLSGDGAHLWSSYLGGRNVDAGYGIAVDAAENVFVTGLTLSTNWTHGGYDTTQNGDYDGFVVKLSASGAFDWSTYLGARSADAGHGVATDAAGNAFVTGYTHSGDWISGGADDIPNGGNDAFLLKLAPNGTPLWSTYLGGDGDDEGSGVATDGAGNVFVSGHTYSANWVSGGFTRVQSGGRDAFVAKLSGSGARIWTTYLGGSSDDSGYAIATDYLWNVLIAGDTSSSGWVAGAYDTTYNGGSTDGYIAKIRTCAANLEAEPTSLDFGAYAWDAGTTGPLTVTITNKGGGPLAFTGNGIAITGMHPAEFRIAPMPATTLLFPGENRFIPVYFDPTLNVLRTARLRITTSDVENPILDIPLRGRGTGKMPAAARDHWTLFE